MSSIHELLKQVYPLKLRMELFNAIWFNWRTDIKEKDQQITDLEAKLAESERKNFELLTKLNLKEHKPAFCTLADRDCEALGQVEELQKQLHDLPKKIVGEIRDDMSKRIIEKQIKWGDNIQIGFICNAINECLDTILKKYGEEDESK